MIETTIVQQVIAGVIGGVATGIAALSVFRVEIKYLRRDVDHAHKRLDRIDYIKKGVKNV